MGGRIPRVARAVPVVVGVALGVALLPATPAAAHNSLTGSNPVNGARVADRAGPGRAALSATPGPGQDEDHSRRTGQYRPPAARRPSPAAGQRAVLARCGRALHRRLPGAVRRRASDQGRGAVHPDHRHRRPRLRQPPVASTAPTTAAAEQPGAAPSPRPPRAAADIRRQRSRAGSGRLGGGGAARGARHRPGPAPPPSARR